MDDSIQGFGSLEVSTISRSLPHQTYISDQMVTRKLKVCKANIEWSGVAWICTKQLKHYPAFSRNGNSIAVHSFVFILAEEESHYVGYLEDMYEDRKGQKKVKVRWFHHNQEVKRVIPQLNAHPREVFITPHVQVISAESIDSLATVLTPKHYEKCMTIVSHTSPSGVHMCFRQFKNYKVKPFTLTKLRGYCNQAILSSLGGPLVSNQKIKCYKSNEEDKEDLTDSVTASGKRNRSGQGQEGLENGSSVSNSVPENQVMKCKPTYPKLRLRFSGMRNAAQPQFPSTFMVGEKIELLSEDSGIRGCWFRCKVLRASKKKLRVQYDDLEDADGSGKLEECVPAFKVASSDTLGMRCPGRLTIRPRPPKGSGDCKFEVGAPIDVWWCDGWWEGIVTRVGTSNNDDMQVYLPGENNFLTIARENARTSRDWISNNWVDIKGRPDILSYLSAVNHGTKLLPNSSGAEASGSGISPSQESNVLAVSKLDSVKEVELELRQSATPSDLKDMNEINLRKRARDNKEYEINKYGGVDAYNCYKELENVDDPSKKSELVLFKEIELDLPQSATSSDLKGMNDINCDNKEYEINKCGGGDAYNCYKELEKVGDPSKKGELVLVENLESAEHRNL